MKIIEKFVMSKTGFNEYCEDKIFMNDHFACIVDGSSSKIKFPANKQPGLLAAEIICDEISQFTKEISAYDAMERLTQRVKEESLKIEMTEMNKEYRQRISATLIMYSNYYHEIWRVGDCQCLIGKKLHKDTYKIDKVMSEARSLFLELELLSGKNIEDLLKKDTGREFILPLLKKQLVLQNQETKYSYAYFVIDGQTIPKNKIDIIKIPKHVKNIILGSDGYPKIKSSLTETENELKRILEKDPLCYKIFKSTKGLQKDYVSFDDRAYLKILV